MRNPAYRLPTTTRPRHYEVSITPYFDVVPTPNILPFTFDGEVTVYVSPTQENVGEIVMHSNHLTIQTVTVQLNGNSVAIQGFEHDEPYNFLRINVTQNLQVGQEYVVRIGFRGLINNNMRGFYRSWYRDSSIQGLTNRRYVLRSYTFIA